MSSKPHQRHLKDSLLCRYFWRCAHKGPRFCPSFLLFFFPPVVAVFIAVVVVVVVVIVAVGEVVLDYRIDKYLICCLGSILY